MAHLPKNFFISKKYIDLQLMKNKILITGTAGFIGFSLAKNLYYLMDYTIIGLDNINSYYSRKLKLDRLQILKKKFENFKFYKLDIRNKKKLFKFLKS